MVNQEIDVLEEIQKIYADVSEWLKFVEAKHAGLFAVWTALMIALVSSDNFLTNITIEKAAVFISILIGILVDLFSFMPFLNRCKILKKLCYNKYTKYQNDGNLIFYQEIFLSTYNQQIDLQESLKKYREDFERKGFELHNNKLAMDYLKQIIEVSTVGTIKTFLFNIAVIYAFVILLAGMCLIIIA